jgi:iron(II)-dependent oxidoreductase
MVRTDTPEAEIIKTGLRNRLSQAREKTLWLLDLVPDEFLRKRIHSFYSPIGWHFGHVGRTEEFWAIGEALNRPLLDSHLTFLFADLPENPKDNRVNIPDRAGLIDYLNQTRARVLQALDELDLNTTNELLKNGYAWEFALQHECQHQETICEMLQLIQRELGPRELPAPQEWRSDLPKSMVPIPGGRFTMGSDEPFVYDNEREPHEVQVEPFKLARTPVTALEWSEFMRDNGYLTEGLWSEEGWTWRQSENATRPEYWLDPENGYFSYGPLGIRAIHPDEPVCSISHHEAEAYARWINKRLPTEQEWEYVAVRFADPDSATHGMTTMAPTPCSPTGVKEGIAEMSGNVWEWTSSTFLPYEGFRAYPYDGYSRDHMKGEHRVCRGGSWATARPILRRTFRNWYVPGYRQGLLGVRLAENA